MVKILEELNEMFQKIKTAYIFIFLLRPESAVNFEMQISDVREKIGKISESFKFLSKFYKCFTNYN